ncbi:MAG: fructosamine kinase family protein [Deltaproteobacteria bacterium]|nr:fructosamine kinase family protein [Deltaproteobacteria bacterium]
MTLPPSLLEQLSRDLGSPVKMMHSMSGGCINNAAIMSLGSSGYYFLKWNTHAPKGFFAAEAFGLSKLEQTEVIKVPKVITYADNDKSEVDYLVLELLSSSDPSVEDLEKFAQQLAMLHKVISDEYGLERNNFIGSLPQENTEMSNWGEFFFNQRLVKQAQLGSVSGWFDYNFERLFAVKQQVIIDLLNEVNDEGPTLLHGDLWSGNVYWTKEGAALIDPAVYFGNREADIAFSEMFGGFGRRFYQAYQDAYPLRSGYPKRKIILNLYHQMTHANMFGGSYVSEAYSSLTRI